MRPPPSNTVVVVEESQAVRPSSGEMLASRGFRVQAAVDPAEALDLVRARAADVVVLGLERRGETLDFIRRLRGRFEPIPLTASARILVAAADMDDSHERFARRLGADVVVRAPLRGEAVADLVRRLARQPAGSGPRAAAS